MHQRLRNVALGAVACVALVSCQILAGLEDRRIGNDAGAGQAGVAGSDVVRAAAGSPGDASEGGAGGTNGNAARGTKTGGTATGSRATGGVSIENGGVSTGGTAAKGGTAAAGGIAPDTGGNTADGGIAPDTGGSTSTATGGNTAAGGIAPDTGGDTSTATGGSPPATGGSTATGGATVAGGTTSGEAGSTAAGGGSAVDCLATMPTNGTDHCGALTAGNAGDLSWTLWSNAINGDSCITTYNTNAFGARWNNAGDFMAYAGLEWASTGKLYDEYGTITAQFAYTRTGTGGGYSYIGIYGWSDNPCVEFYIVEDSFNKFPFNAYNATEKGTVSIDGTNYKLFQATTMGTAAMRCNSVSSWSQFWSIRQQARKCGTVPITQHFDAWKAANMMLGELLEVKILVEVGGGTGSVDFPVASVTVAP